MRAASRLGMWLVLLVYVGLAVGYGLVVPPFENLDEIEHFGVVRYVADHGRLPVHGMDEAEIYHYRQEASQPPLYHLLSAGLVRVLGLRSDDAVTFFRFNPRVACGPESAAPMDNRAVFYHDPNREVFPWEQTLLMIHTLRIWSTFLQAITVIGTYALGRLVIPDRREVALVAMSIVAFNPQFLLVASGVNNDNLATPLATVGLYLLLQSWREGLTVRRAVGLGVVIGLAGLSKLSGWLLLGLAGLLTLGLLVRAREEWKRLLLAALVIPAVALLLTGWWFWRNHQLYGDLTALQPMLELVGVRESPIFPLLEANLMFRSFWGQIPCAFYPVAFYVPYVLLTVLSFTGFIWRWRKLGQQRRWLIVILASWFLIVTLGWIRWDAMTPAVGGRLLFSALPALAVLMALGLEKWWQGKRMLGMWATVGALALLALWTVVRILPSFFAPPARYSEPSAVQPGHPLEVTLGDSTRLIGYDVSLVAQDLTLDLALYWQATAPLVEDYILALQLVSPVPGDTTMRWNYNSWPGRGNYPTSAWQAGEVILDRYRVRLPKSSFVTQAWDLHLALYQDTDGERLPVQVGGTPLGARLVLTRLRVPGELPHCPEDALLPSEVVFGESVALTHASVAPGQERTMVTLCWKALQPLPVDYTVFVHLQDGSGGLVDTGDGPPMQGAFPTSTWVPGDVIADAHSVGPLTVGSEYRIAVGLYNPTDGLRLPAYRGGEPLSNAAAVVWLSP